MSQGMRVAPALAASFAVFLAASLAASPARAIFAGQEVDAKDDLARRVIQMQVEQRLYCSATVLTPRVLLTTAPCALGARRAQARAAEGEMIELARVIVHPDWNPARQGGWGTTNLGLVLLAKPLPDAPNQIESLSETAIPRGESVLIAGFGRTFRDNAATAGRLRRAEVSLTQPLQPTIRDTISIGTTDANVDKPIASACLGDLGGGAFVGDAANRRLVGMLVGYVPPQGAVPDTCGGRTNIIRLSAVKDWLTSQVRALEAWERPR